MQTPPSIYQFDAKQGAHPCYNPILQTPAHTEKHQQVSGADSNDRGDIRVRPSPLEHAPIPADAAFDHNRRHSSYHTVALVESPTDQGAGRYHCFGLQYSPFEYLDITPDPYPISDTHIARAIEPLAAGLIEDRMFVPSTDDDIRGQHAIPTNIDARRFIHQ